MNFSQKHEDQPVAPALSRGSRQEESYATPLAGDLEDVETAIAGLELGRSDRDVRHDASMDRSQGTTGLGISALSNPTPLGPPGLQESTKTDITGYVEPETKFLREERPLGPISRLADRPENLGLPEPSSLAAPISSTASQSEDSFELSDTLKHLMIDRLFERWSSRASEEKILRDKHERILREAPHSLASPRRSLEDSHSGHVARPCSSGGGSDVPV